jgi:hypothetical protein
MADGEVISFLGDQWHPDRRVRVLILEPGDAVDVQPADWSDALVIVERGCLQIECDRGARAVFGSGAVLALTMPELRRLRSVGTTALVLSAVSRPGPEDLGRSSPSGE